MYQQLVIESNVQIPPKKFGKNIEDAAFEILSQEYNGLIDEFGFVIMVTEVLEVRPGKILTGFPTTHHPVVFQILVYKPEKNEVVEGTLVELVEFGAFIRLGPADALVHVSQISDDYFKYEVVAQRLYGRETNKTLQVNDKVRGKIIAENMSAGGKLGLTLKHPFLGKFSWIEENLNEIYHPDEKEDAFESESEEKEASEEEIDEFDEFDE